MPSPLPDDVRQALRGGRKIDALRLLRARTGIDLRQALAALDSGLVSSNPGPDSTGGRPRPLSGPHQLHGSNDTHAAQARRHRAAGLSPGEVPRSRLGGALWIVFVVLLLVLWVLAGNLRSGTSV
ncbi:MAG: hypothetical protein ABIN96_17930 [Rubrivivax sp.]